MTETTTPALRVQQATTLSLLFSAGVVNFFDRSSLAIANNTIRSEMHLSATDIGWLLSVFSFAYGLSQLPLITLLPRLGARRVLGGGLVLWSSAQLLTGFVRGFPPFLALRAMLGAGESPFYPAGVQTVRDLFPARSRGRATAVMSMSQTLGLAVAPPLLSLLILHVGWRVMFIDLGAAGLVVAAAWLLLHRPTHVIADDEVAAATVGESAWRLLLRQRIVWGAMLGFGGINYTNWLYTAWIPGYLQTARHLSLARTGWVAAVPFLAGAVGMFSSGLFTDLRAPGGLALATIHRANIVVGMVLSAACTLCVARSVSTVGAVAGICGALFCIHFAGTSAWGYAQAVSPAPLVASLSALQNFASFLIASVAPVLTGWLLDRTHAFTIAFAVCSGVTLLGALSYATLCRRDAMTVAARPTPA